MKERITEIREWYDLTVMLNGETTPKEKELLEIAETQVKRIEDLEKLLRILRDGIDDYWAECHPSIIAKCNYILQENISKNQDCNCGSNENGGHLSSCPQVF